MEIINWRLVGHPLNWVTVFLMVFVGGLLAHLVLTYFGQQPAAVKAATGQPNS